MKEEIKKAKMTMIYNKIIDKVFNFYKLNCIGGQQILINKYDGRSEIIIFDNFFGVYFSCVLDSPETKLKYFFTENNNGGIYNKEVNIINKLKPEFLELLQDIIINIFELKIVEEHGIKLVTALMGIEHIEHIENKDNTTLKHLTVDPKQIGKISIVDEDGEGIQFQENQIPAQKDIIKINFR